MKHIKELKLNEDFRHHGYEASTFADITTENIIDMIKKRLEYGEKFFQNPAVKSYLENYAKDLMNGFWNEITDKEKLDNLSKDLEREYEGPDHPFFPQGVFRDPTK